MDDENTDLNATAKGSPAAPKPKAAPSAKAPTEKSQSRYMPSSNDDEEEVPGSYAESDEAYSQGSFVRPVGSQNKGHTNGMQNKDWLPRDFGSMMFANGEDTTFLRNPQNYKFLPYNATKKIEMAGRATAPSDHVEEVICMKTNKFY